MLEDQKAAGPDGKSIAETSQKLVVIGVARPSAVNDVPEAPASAHSAKEWNRFHREELVMTVSNAALTWLGGVGGMSLALFGLGLGWNLSYVAATTELVSVTSPQERGRIVGFADLLASFTAAGLALLGGVVYTAAGVTALALGAAALAAVPALWLGSSRFRYTAAPADT